MTNPFGNVNLPSTEDLLNNTNNRSTKNSNNMNGAEIVTIERVTDPITAGGKTLKYKVSAGPTKFENVATKKKARKVARRFKKQTGASRIKDMT